MRRGCVRAGCVPGQFPLAWLRLGTHTTRVPLTFRPGQVALLFPGALVTRQTPADSGAPRSGFWGCPGAEGRPPSSLEAQPFQAHLGRADFSAVGDHKHGNQTREPRSR